MSETPKFRAVMKPEGYVVVERVGLTDSLAGKAVPLPALEKS